MLTEAIENLRPGRAPAGMNAKIVGYHLPEWTRFVNSSGLEKINLHEYYLGEELLQITDGDYAKLLTELFADAVAVGAIVLPSLYKAEDFLFEVSYDSYTFQQKAELSLRSEPGRKEFFYYFSHYVGRESMLLSSSMAHVLAHLADNVNSLCEEPV